MSTLAQHPTHFLVVDDDPVCVLNAQRAFARTTAPQPLWTAIDGRAALELLRGPAIPPRRRVVLLDMHMPRMGGLAMLRELRADPALHLITVVMLTSTTDVGDRREAFAQRVAGCLVKPRSFATFVDMIGTVCRFWAAVDLP